MIEQLKCSTPDFAEENVAKLIKLFPEVEGEKGTVDLDKLRQVLSSKVIEGNVERYEFTWPGKRAAKAAASAATTKTLRPCREESVNFDTTENLYIEGDNLEVLKLLQTSYAGKVKMIYIDPPYNTGHDFVYRDKFSLTQKELEDEAGSFDEDGNRFEVNDSAEARYHSNWCSMMYPRLKLARNLLRDDGVLFVSIDDNEVVNARKLCDEVFGEAQFSAIITVVVKPEGRRYGPVAKTHEFILVYCRDSENDSIREIVSNDAKFDFTDGKGGFNLQGLRNRNVQAFNSLNRPNLRYPFYVNATNDNASGFYEVSTKFHEGWQMVEAKIVEGMESVWRWGKDTAEQNKDDLVACRRSDGCFRIFQKTRSLAQSPKSVWVDKSIISNKGTHEVQELLGKGVFDFPKPVELLRRLVEMGSSAESLVLDFFSGSAASAHAVMQLNAEDGGNRKFIMVQLPEPCAEDSEAAKVGYQNICEIGKERIRRAGKKIADENATTAPNLDIGFRVLKLDSSSLNDTSATVSETDQKFANFDRIKEGRSSEDLLFQMLLETHIPLSDKIE